MEQNVRENKMGIMPVNKLLLNMAVPMIVSMLVQALYNVVDSVFVAKLSEDALNAVSLAFPVQNLMISVGVGTGVGINALLSRSLGQKEQDKVDRTAMNGLLLAAISCLVFMIFGLTCGRRFYAIQTDIQTIVHYGGDYLTICCGMCFGMFAQITLERILQATGRTFYTMITQATGAVINIILDPIFIFAMGMGVKGGALATVISQAVSCIWVISFLCGKKTQLRLKVSNMKLKKSVILPCVALGAATFVMQASESIISVCFNSSLLKYGGDVAVGAMTILTSVMQFAMLPMQGIGQGAQPIMSFNYGAGKIDRVKKAFWLLLKVTFAYSTLIWLAVMIFPQVFVGLFTSDATLLVFTKTALRIYMACVFLMGIQIACQMAFTSIGCAKESILVAVTRKFILLIPLIYIVPLIWRSNQTLAVYLAEPIADFFAVSFTVILFSIQFKKALEKAPESSAQASADRSAQA